MKHLFLPQRNSSLPSPAAVRHLFLIACLLLLASHAHAWRFLGMGTPSASQRPRFACRYDGQRIRWIRLPHQQQEKPQYK